MCAYPKVLPNGNLLVKKPSWDIEDDSEVWEEVPAWKMIHLEANGGYDICDEWNFSGSYSIDVKPGDIGNSYYYSGRLVGDYHKIKYRNGRRTRGPKFELVFGVTCPNVGIQMHTLLTRKGVSIRKAKMLIVDAIRAYEATDHFKIEIWPKILHPDRMTHVVKETSGEFLWVASTWRSLWNYVQTKSLSKYFCSAAGHGDFYGRSIRMDYHPTENRKEKRYAYSHVRSSGGMVSGSGLNPEREEELKRKIDAAIFPLSNSSMVEHYLTWQHFSSLYENYRG